MGDRHWTCHTRLCLTHVLKRRTPFQSTLNQLARAQLLKNLLAYFGGQKAVAECILNTILHWRRFPLGSHNRRYTLDRSRSQNGCGNQENTNHVGKSATATSATANWLLRTLSLSRHIQLLSVWRSSRTQGESSLRNNFRADPRRSLFI